MQSEKWLPRGAQAGARTLVERVIRPPTPEALAAKHAPKRALTIAKFLAEGVEPGRRTVQAPHVRALPPQGSVMKPLFPCTLRISGSLV